MQPMSRRDALTRLGLGTAGLLLSPHRSPASPPAIELGDLTALAERFRQTTRAGIFDVAARAIQAGADSRTLLGAAFVAGVHDVRPRGVGGKLHCVMMVESAFQLSATSTTREAWLAALWSVDDFKNSQQRDLDEGDWVLPPRPDVSFNDEGQARREFSAAMEAWDAERADRALVGLLPYHDRASLFELLWPFAARCFVDIGHKIIFCAQVERVLQRLGWHHAEPALRSLVNGLLYRSDSISGSELQVFEQGRRLAASFPSRWLDGKEAPEHSKMLMKRLRDCDPASAQQLVIDAFADGLGPKTVWDGLRLYASEIFHQRPRSAARRHGPVHGVTEVNAFHHAWRTTRVESTRRLMILQAAGWLPLMRHALIRFFGTFEGPGLDALGTDGGRETSPTQEVFERLSPAVARRYLDRDPGHSTPFLGQLRGNLVHRAFQSHQYKYAAAIQEESTLVHPRWASRILAPAITYLPNAADPEAEVAERSLHLLRRVGLA